MSDLEEDSDTNPPVGKTSIRMGPAFLQWIDLHHLGMYRQIITVTNHGGGEIERKVHGQPIGPLGVYRRARRGDQVTMRTNDPKTGEPMELALEWRPGMSGSP